MCGCECECECVYIKDATKTKKKRRKKRMLFLTTTTMMDDDINVSPTSHDSACTLAHGFCKWIWIAITPH